MAESCRESGKWVEHADPPVNYDPKNGNTTASPSSMATRYQLKETCRMPRSDQGKSQPQARDLDFPKPELPGKTPRTL